MFLKIAQFYNYITNDVLLSVNILYIFFKYCIIIFNFMGEIILNAEENAIFNEALKQIEYSKNNSSEKLSLSDPWYK